MLRVDDKIRLSEKERKDFGHFWGLGEAPTTVAEYNKRLEQAAKAWETSEPEISPEAKLLAAIARDQKLSE
jgi:hypothetical protein